MNKAQVPRRRGRHSDEQNRCRQMDAIYALCKMLRSDTDYYEAGQSELAQAPRVARRQGGQEAPFHEIGERVVQVLDEGLELAAEGLGRDARLLAKALRKRRELQEVAREAGKDPSVLSRKTTRGKLLEFLWRYFYQC